MISSKMEGKLLRYVILVALIIQTYISHGEKFEGKAKSYGVDIVTADGATALSLKPPQSSVKTSGGNFQYDKVDAKLGPQQPYSDQYVAMVEAKGPKLDVKGDYPKWKSKIVKIKKKKMVSHVHMLPLHGALALKSEERVKTRQFSKGDKSKVDHVLLLLRALPLKTAEKVEGREHLKGNKRIFEKDSDVRSYEYDNSESAEKIIDNLNVIHRATRSLGKLLEKQQFYKTEERQRRNRREIARRDLSEDDETNSDKEDLELENYANGMKNKVTHVVNEAKNVLVITSKVVHGLKRVIDGAKKLTEFSNNAVKFAKYFALEPNNATIDFFEEKAVIAVLEAQKAAAEAKIEALIAKEAANKILDMLRKVKKKKLGKSKIANAAKLAKLEVKIAEKAAKKTSDKQNEAKEDAIVVDKALRHMTELLKKDSGEKTRKEESNKAHEKGEVKSISEEERLSNEQNASGEEDEKKGGSGAKELYEKIKNEIEKPATYKTNNSEAIKGLEQTSFEGGGDENEIIANDFSHNNNDNEKDNGTKSGYLEEKVEEIKKGPLNIVVRVNRRKIGNRNKTQALEPKSEIERLEDDPFDFKEMLQANEKHSVAVDDGPFDYRNNIDQSKKRSAIQTFSNGKMAHSFSERESINKNEVSKRKIRTSEIDKFQEKYPSDPNKQPNVDYQTADGSYNKFF